jgi:hypothetical protein
VASSWRFTRLRSWASGLKVVLRILLVEWKVGNLAFFFLLLLLKKQLSKKSAWTLSAGGLCELCAATPL